MRIAVSRLHFPITALGPGRRVGVWVQGCSIRCAGCISLDTWDHGTGIIDLEDLLDTLDGMAVSADGITVSGGEPFDQPEALAAILAQWRSASDTSTLVFTGREIDDVAPWISANPGLLDAVMTGPFRSDLPQTTALRGSDNQTLHVLTERGAEMRGYDRPAVTQDRRLDVMFDEEGSAWFAGIPARGDMARLRRALATAGTRAVTSDSVGSLGR